MRGKLETFLLAFFFGNFGAHRFYTGRLWSGAVWALTHGIFGIGSLVDMVSISSNKYLDSDGNVLYDECHPGLCWGLTVLGFIFYLVKMFLIIFVLMISMNTLSGSQSENSFINIFDAGIHDVVADGEEDSHEDGFMYVDLAQMFTDMETDLTAAQTTYQDMYVQVTGYIADKDIEGLFISLSPDPETVYAASLTCYPSDTSIQNSISKKPIGSQVTVKGKIITVDSRWGYEIDISSIS